MAWPKGVPRKGYKKPAMIDLPPDEPTKEPELHGMTGVAIVRPCPMCLYAYADGGYCPECGWSLPVYTDEYGTNSGGRH